MRNNFKSLPDQDHEDLDKDEDEDGQRYLGLPATWAALECGLGRIRIRIPTDVMLHVFTFLDIMDYVCSVSLVCKSWTLDTNDILMKKTKYSDTGKFKLLQTTMYNSFVGNLYYFKKEKYRSYIIKEDLLYEMETSLAFVLSHTTPYQRVQLGERDERDERDERGESNIFNVLNKINRYFEVAQFPAQSLYFSTKKANRRFTYLYLLHYIYLYKFAPRDAVIMGRMYIMLGRVVFTGSTLNIGFMMELFYDKFGNQTESRELNQLKEDKFNNHFWIVFRCMFHAFYVQHKKHVQNKPMYVLDETVHSFVRVAALYAVKWNRPRKWMNWRFREPNNVLNDMITEADAMY